MMHCWYNGYADPKEMKRLGYKLVSIPDGLVFSILFTILSPICNTIATFFKYLCSSKKKLLFFIRKNRIL